MNSSARIIDLFWKTIRSLVVNPLGLSLLGTGFAESPLITTLRNEHLQLDFSQENGNLRQITNLHNGEEFLHDPTSSRLVKIIQRTPEKSSNILLSQDAGRPKMEILGNALTIKFPSLRDEGEETEVYITVKVRLPEGSPEAFFTLVIENQGKYPLVEAWFPYIAGRVGRKGETGDVFTTSHGQETDLYGRFDRGVFNTHAFGRHLQRIGLGGGNLLPMMDLSTGTGGLSYIKYEKKARPTDFVYENLSRGFETIRLGWAWATTILLKPGQTFRSVEFGVGVHQSDWHATADRLRKFMDTWWSPSNIPPSLKEKIGLFHVQIKGFNGEPFHDFDEIPAIARDCRKYGIKDMSIWDYTASVYSRPDAAGDYWEMPETRMNMLKQSLEKVKEMGFQISACVNYRLVNKISRAWKRIGSEAQVSFFGVPLYGNPAGSMNGAIYFNRYYEQGTRSLCQGTARFRQFALELTGQTLDIGFNSLFIDQTMESSYALPKGRSDLNPFVVMDRAYEWFGEATRMVRERDSEAYSIGEVPNLWNTQSVDAWWVWGWDYYFLPELYLYLMPEMCLVLCIDENQRPHISKAFALGALLAIATRDMTGMLSDTPEFAAQIARLAHLRKETADYVSHGRFVNQRGLTVTGGSGYVFLSDKGLAITLANAKNEKATILVQIDPEKLPQAAFKSGKIHREGSDRIEVKPWQSDNEWHISVTLGPYEAAVWTIPGKANTES